jgi:hypothetical protein
MDEPAVSSAFPTSGSDRNFDRSDEGRGIGGACVGSLLHLITAFRLWDTRLRPPEIDLLFLEEMPAARRRAGLGDLDGGLSDTGRTFGSSGAMSAAACTATAVAPTGARACKRNPAGDLREPVKGFLDPDPQRFGYLTHFSYSKRANLGGIKTGSLRTIASPEGCRRSP